MKSICKAVLVTGVLYLLTVPGFAETKYVTDTITLTFRSGPSNEHKIISLLKSGQRMEVLEAGDKWARVRVADGREGWVLTQYLSDEPASRDLLANLQEKYQILSEQSATALEENEKLKEENTTLRAVVSDHEKALESLRKDYETLQSESAGFIELKKQYDEAAAQLAAKNERLSRLEEQVASMELNHYIKWFLAGSGVLAFGFVIGFSSRKRRRSSLL